MIVHNIVFSSINPKVNISWGFYVLDIIIFIVYHNNNYETFSNTGNRNYCNYYPTSLYAGSFRFIEILIKDLTKPSQRKVF